MIENPKGTAETWSWLSGRALSKVTIDLPARRIQLGFDRGQVEFQGVHSTTLLGLWDGRPGTVEWMRVVHEEKDRCCLELRVQFGVPRVYRIVCERVRGSE